MDTEDRAALHFNYAARFLHTNFSRKLQWYITFENKSTKINLPPLTVTYLKQEEGEFMKNEMPFISSGTIFERLFIKGIIFRIVQEIISIGRRDESLFYIWFYRSSHSYYLLLKNVKYKKCSRHTFYCVHIASQLIIS